MQRPRGAVNLVNLTLFVAVVAGGYLAWLWVPLWLDDFDVREAMAVALSQLGEGQTEASVQKTVAGRLAQVGFHFEEHDGEQVEIPGLGLTPSDVQIEHEGRTARVTVDYSRTVKLKPLDRYWTFHFNTGREAVLH